MLKNRCQIKTCHTEKNIAIGDGTFEGGRRMGSQQRKKEPRNIQDLKSRFSRKYYQSFFQKSDVKDSSRFARNSNKSTFTSKDLSSEFKKSFLNYKCMQKWTIANYNILLLVSFYLYNEITYYNLLSLSSTPPKDIRKMRLYFLQQTFFNFNEIYF